MAEQTYALSQSGVYGLANGAYADALSAIPDSAVHQYKIGEGSGSTVADSIGSADLTNNGAAWLSMGDAVGGYELSHDGTDDHLTRSPDSLLSINNSFSIAFTCTPETTSREYLFINGNFDGHFFVITVDNGYVATGFGEDASDMPRSYQSNQQIDGSRQRYCVTFDGVDTTTTYVDASGSSSLDSDAKFRATDAKTDEFAFGRDNNGRYGQFDLDNPIVYDAELTASEVQEDYDAQPWT